METMNFRLLMTLAGPRENYIVAQTTQASLGQVPRNALAVGVIVDGTDVRVRFQLADLNADDIEDMDDIVFTLELLVGDHVHVEKDYEIRAERAISPDDGVRWIYLARLDDE